MANPNRQNNSMSYWGIKLSSKRNLHPDKENSKNNLESTPRNTDKTENKYTDRENGSAI